MPASDNVALQAVDKEVRELERLCGELEKALVAGDWQDATETLHQTRRVTHAFRNAMEAAAPVRDAAFDEGVYARVKRVYDVRHDQLERLQTFHDEVGRRLQTLSTWKIFARSIGARKVRPRSVGLDSRR